MLGEQSYKYLTVDEMKSLGDDSVAIDVTSDEKHMRQEQINQQKQVWGEGGGKRGGGY